MSIWGKIIGGVAGFALGGPLGALVGGAAGHMYDAKKAEETGTGSNVGARQVAFTTAVIVLAAKMAKADGVVSRDEILAFRECFHVPPGEEGDIGRIFNQARQDAAGYEPYAEQVAQLFAHEPEVLDRLLGALFHIAKADGRVHPAELEFLRRTALILGFTEQEFERLKTANLGEPNADPYEILGVGRGWSDDAIKQHYRKLIRENHPDRLIAKGMPQEFIDLANEKVAQINAAYEEIQKDRA